MRHGMMKCNISLGYKKRLKRLGLLALKKILKRVLLSTNNLKLKFVWKKRIVYSYLLVLCQNETEITSDVNLNKYKVPMLLPE